MSIGNPIGEFYGMGGPAASQSSRGFRLHIADDKAYKRILVEIKKRLNLLIAENCPLSPFEGSQA